MPTPESPDWVDILPQSGVVGILGKRRHGKTALAYHIAEERHRANRIPAVVLGPPVELASKFPSWFTIVTDLSDFRHYPNHTAIVDEGSFPLHARQSLSRQHTEFDQALSLCGQMEQLFIFCTHHSRKLDPLAVEEYEVLAFKLPGKMHTRMERPEMREWSARAREALMKFSEEERKGWSFVLYDDLEEEALLPNPLPGFWSEEISRAVSIAAQALLPKEISRAVSIAAQAKGKAPQTHNPAKQCPTCGSEDIYDLLEGTCEICRNPLSSVNRST